MAGKLDNMQAIAKLEQQAAGEYRGAAEAAKAKDAKKGSGPHIPKTDIEKRHKIILFGRIYKGCDEVVEKLYTFTHQRADGVITEGYIAVGFLSMLPVEDDNL